MFAQLHAAAVESAGEPLSGLLGNDYACGTPGGPPRAGHVARAGQLWVLDLGPTVRGYNADSCRAYAVDGQPTDVQQRTFAALCGVFPIVERMARPGRPLSRPGRRGRGPRPGATWATASRTTSGTASASSRTRART